MKSLLLALLIVAPSLLWGQKKILNDKVEVTKSYQHQISKASKRDIKPTKEDSVTMNIPKLEYSISHKPDRYPFTISQLPTPIYMTSDAEKLFPGYADISLGMPLATGVTASYGSLTARNTVLGAIFKHNGFWGDIEDKMGVSRSGLTTDNTLSLFLDYEHESLKTSVMINQEYDMFNRYGYNVTPVDESQLKQSFIKSTVIAEVGSPEWSSEKFNYNIDMSYNLIIDNYGYDESSYHFGASIGKELKSVNGTIMGNVEYLSVIPSRDFTLIPTVGTTLPTTQPTLPDGTPAVSEPISSSGYLTLTPQYIFKYKGVHISVGALINFAFNASDINYKQNVTTIIPKGLATVSMLNGKLKPYVAVNGDFIVNNYFTLSEMNPYIVQGLTAPNTTIYRYFAGIKGAIGSSVIYDINIGSRRSDDLVMFVNSDDGNVFRAITDDYNNTEINFEVGYRYSDKLSFDLDIQYINYDKDNEVSLLSRDIVIGYAPIVANLTANYKVNDKLQLSLGMKSLSERTFADVESDNLTFYTVASVTDLSLQGSYDISERMGAKVKLGNLLNEALYPYANYKGVGVNAMATFWYKF